MEWLSVRQIISDEEIEQLEVELKIKLPKDYKRMIGKINGGALKNAYIKHATMDEIAYDRNVSLKREAKTNVYILIPIINEKEIKYFPFGSVGNGDYFCFDLDKNQVVLYIHELQIFKYVCDTFEQLLSMIISDDDN